MEPRGGRPGGNRQGHGIRNVQPFALRFLSAVALRVLHQQQAVAL